MYSDLIALACRPPIPFLMYDIVIRGARAWDPRGLFHAVSPTPCEPRSEDWVFVSTALCMEMFPGGNGDWCA